MLPQGGRTGESDGDKANKQQRQESAERAAVLAESVSVAEKCCSMFAVLLKTAPNLAIEKALAELAEFAASWAAMLVEMALTTDGSTLP
jgi:hypothetical protein